MTTKKTTTVYDRVKTKAIEVSNMQVRVGDAVLVGVVTAAAVSAVVMSKAKVHIIFSSQ